MMKQTRLLSFLLLICLLLSFSSCFKQNANSSSSTTDSIETNIGQNDGLVVHYLDVGQGDSIFIELPNGECMLIDASVSKYKSFIADSIKRYGYEQIDYVVATHSHADHIGGMTYILDTFEIGCIYLPDASAATQTYITMAETIIENDIKAVIAQAGEVVIDEQELKAVFLAPFEIDENDQNKNSAVLYLSYGETSFLFMGDADIEIEQQIGKVDCDVLKVGHHGSRTASDSDFLEYASPMYAIISCGEGNSYGHPHQEAVDRLNACGAQILRTDLLGTITIHSDGKDLTVAYGKEDIELDNVEESIEDEEIISSDTQSPKWILNTSSKKVHRTDCKHVMDISEKNKKESFASLQELFEEGYTACGTCKPQE